MTQEKLHEALNLLDDDLIEATDALRRRRHRSNWLAVAALAACLGLVCFMALWPPFAKNKRTDNGMYAPESAVSDAHNYGVLEAPEASPVSSMQVRVIQLLDNGFTAAVISADSDDYAVGQTVTLIFAKGAEVTLEPEMEISVRYVRSDIAGTLIACEVEK